MRAPDDYTLEKCFSSSSRVQVYAAVRESDGRKVALKVYTLGASSESRSRARSEFEQLRQSAGTSVVEALDLVESAERTVLVLERVAGLSFSAWVRAGLPSLSDFLEVGIALAAALARVHEARLLHCAVCPDHVLVDPVTRQTRLIGFGRARPLGAASLGTEGSSEARRFKELPHYIAPEQTGRMDRGIDSRSDLYALGATLYFGLTGAPPFDGDDPLALIHAHMARNPTPPLERRPDLPPTLSRIVLKLLQKEPEDRYQSALALQRDLVECRDQLVRVGRIEDDFPLGTADAPYRPHFTRKVYGREAEIAALHEAYARAALGATELALLIGAPGAGKSTLVHELRRALPETGGYLAAGKFDLFRRDVPYAGLVSAFDALIQQILAESDERLARWRESLRRVLGNLAGVMVELVADLGIVLGPVPAAPVLGPRETQARLALAVQRFVQGCAGADHPLVLFVDDLQWADPGSRDVLESLLRDSRAGHLLVLAAYRSSEVDDRHPLHSLLQRVEAVSLEPTRIELAPLSQAACARMLADALGRTVRQTERLAECVVRKTGSNPLLIQQFVLYLHGLGLFRFVHPEGWTWDDAAIASAHNPERAVALMVAKLERLAAEPRQLLAFVSCLAYEFDIELLVERSSRPREELEPLLFALATEGLLAPSAHGFRFVHDRIREAAQALLSEEQRSRLHYDTARLLLARIPQAEQPQRIFEIAEHFNHALAHVTEELRATVIQIDFAAGQRALAAGSGSTAAGYFAVARKLLREADWQGQWALVFELHLQSSESAFQMGEFDAALRLLDPLERPSLSDLEFARAAMKRIQVHAVTQPPEQSARYVLGALRRVGVRWPLHPSRLRVELAVRAVLWWMKRRGIENCLRPDPAVDLRRLAAILLIDQGGAALVRFDARLVMLACCLVATHYIRRGFLARPAFTLANYALYSDLLSAGSAQTERLTKVALDWNERVPDALYSPRTELIAHALIRPWLMRRRQALAPLDRVSEAMWESGDREYAMYSRFLKRCYTALAGEPVAEAERALRELSESVRRSGAHYPDPEGSHRAYRLLLEPDASRIQLDAEAAEIDAWIAANPGSAEPYVRTIGLLVFCVYGRHDLAFAQSEKLGERLFRIAPFVHVADHCFYRGFAAAVLAGSARGEPRRRYRRALRQSSSYLRHRAKSGPDFAHMALLLEAERARLRGQFARCRRLYQDAAQRAAQQEFPHHLALAHERHARLLWEQRRKTEAAAALKQAIAAYQRWGAHAKVAALEQEFDSLPASRPTR